jgi:hypothetical protein
MIRSLFFKEWIKSRWVLLVLLVAFTGVIAYSFITLSTGLRVTGVGAVWENTIQKGLTYFDYIKYLPALAGVLLAMAQYAPEITNKRLKLTLHLPMPEVRIMLSMLLFGIGSLTVLFALAYAAIGIGAGRYFPSEVTQWNLTAVVPWLWGGMAAYLLTAWVAIEPVWSRRVFETVVALCLLSLFYFSATPGAYAPLLPWLIGAVALSVVFSLYSLIRFKDGEQ